MARMVSRIVKSIPNTETGHIVSCHTKQKQSGEEYLITECPEKNRFTLWKVLKDGFERISTSESPLDFDDIIPWKYKDT